VDRLATEALDRRLAEYIRPPIDEGLERAINEFVNLRKACKSAAA
jgi:trimethylamine:corrinoid methyltransferase-like protein